jgi:hypothetical protein
MHAEIDIKRLMKTGLNNSLPLGVIIILTYQGRRCVSVG